MVKALIDTNILIDYLIGIDAAARALEQYPDKAISLVTWMEVMAGVSEDPAEVNIIKTFLSGFQLLPIDIGVAAEAVRVRKARKIKLPDAIIQATANLHQCVLVTRNTKDFPAGPGVEVPYT